MIRPITPAKNKFLFKKKQTFPKRHVGIIDFFCILLGASQCNHYTRKPNKSSLEWCYPRKQRQPSQASIDLPAPLKATGSPFIWIVTGYSFLLLFVLDFLLSIVFVRCFKCKQNDPLGMFNKHREVVLRRLQIRSLTLSRWQFCFCFCINIHHKATRELT